MKRFIFVSLIFSLFTVRAFAQLTLTGEIKTGILQTITEDRINPAKTRTDAGSKDDAGSGAGRFRLNVDYFLPSTNIGFKFRLNMEDWTTAQSNMWGYYFAYGNFFKDQLTVSFGKLGASPWGSGGPDLWKEVESGTGIKGGIRFEYKPSFVPGLNVGFVINSFDKDIDGYPASEPITFLDILQESIIGASYTHEYFHIRAAYRFDSEVDALRNGVATGKDGGQLVYRVEERIIGKYLPGFKIWALGHYYGIGADEANIDEYLATNWFFIEYAPKLFTAQIRVGLEMIKKRTVFNLRPAFTLRLFDDFLNIGVQYLFAQDFGPEDSLIGKAYPGSPYYYMEIEPKVQINFAPGFYAAIVYNWRNEYVHPTQDHLDQYGNVVIEPTKQTQWINLRIGMYF